MRTFTNYGSTYDAHRGTRSMNDLTREQQDELIRLMFEPEGDFQEFVMNHDLQHLQPDGLWNILVALGTLLERKAVIEAFPSSSVADRDWVINMLAGTLLWLRLEEAFEPFDRVIRRTEYDWSEIETFGARDAIVEMTDDGIATRLKEFLDPAPRDPDGMEQRMPYQDFVRRWNAGTLQFFVDRGQAVQAYRLSNSIWTSILPFGFIIGLVAFIPIMIFLSFWWGLAVLILAIISRKALTKKAEAWVRKEALDDRTRYRWLTARGVIWGVLHEAGR